MSNLPIELPQQIPITLDVSARGPAGPPGDEQYYGSISLLTDTTVSIPTQNTYVPLVATQAVEGISKGIKQDGAGEIVLKNTLNSPVLVDVYSSADLTAGNNQQIGLKLSVNGNIIDETECRASTGSARVEAKLVTSWLIEMQPNDLLQIRLANIEATTDLVVKRAKLKARVIETL